MVTLSHPAGGLLAQGASNERMCVLVSWRVFLVMWIWVPLAARDLVLATPGFQVI